MFYVKELFVQDGMKQVKKFGSYRFSKYHTGRGMEDLN